MIPYNVHLLIASLVAATIFVIALYPDNTSRSPFLDCASRL
jgi:hypothetical protein